MGRTSLAVVFCVAGIECFGREGIEGSGSLPKTANEIRREEMLRQELAALESHLNGQGIPMSQKGIKKYLQQINTPTLTCHLQTNGFANSVRTGSTNERALSSP